jgi:GT2 family glycosyltransferase
MLHILTLNWNGKDKIQELYNSFLSLNKSFEYIWHIKDNGSTDGSVDLIKSFNDSNINLIEYKHNNDNFAFGTNFLFKNSGAKDGDYILLLNNDIVFSGPNDLNKMLSYFKDPNIGVVGCKLLFKNTDNIQHAGVVFHDQIKMPMYFGGNKKDGPEYLVDREFQSITGAVMLTKKEYYEKIHKNPSGQVGLDESFFWEFEDIAACLHIKYIQNKKVICCGSTKIFHEQSATLKKNPVNKLFRNNNVSNLLTKWNHLYHKDQKKYLDLKYNIYK